MSALTTSSALRGQLTKDSPQAAHCECSSQKTHDKQRTARAAHKRLTTSSALRGQLTALGAALRAEITSARQVASAVALHVTKQTSSSQLSHCCDQGLRGLHLTCDSVRRRRLTTSREMVYQSIQRHCRQPDGENLASKQASLHNSRKLCVHTCTHRY